MSTPKPLVKIIATGGSIAGVRPDRMDYILYPELGQHLSIYQSLERIPEAAGIARLDAEDLVSVAALPLALPNG